MKRLGKKWKKGKRLKSKTIDCLVEKRKIKETKLLLFSHIKSEEKEVIKKWKKKKKYVYKITSIFLMKKIC